MARPAAEWCATHAALPTLDRAAADSRSIWLSVRDSQGRSRVAAGRFGLDGAKSRIELAATPALDLGDLGAFDDSGVTTSCVVTDRGRLYLYYTGWSRGVTVPFYLGAGLAVSDDGGQSFRRVSRAPVLERIDVDPYLTASPWVLHDGGVWRMWYVSATGWSHGQRGPRHHYHIRYAESADLVAWRRTGHVCVDFARPEEYAFGRPCVVRDPGGRYRMWYSVRGDTYRLGYAESDDGLSWTRRDDAIGLDLSPDGFDSQMMAYPAILDRGGRRYMLYNGNDYGRSGVGLAEELP